MYALPSTWQSLTAYVDNGLLGDYVKPSAGKATAFYYRCTTPGTTGATEPVWPLGLGETVTDGTCVWACALIAPVISQRDLEDRVSRPIVQALLDDNNDGFADGGPVARCITDATSYVFGLIGGVYDFPMGSPYPNELQRICLDVAIAYLAVRHPEVVRFDGYAMLDRCRVELKDLKAGVSQLDIPALGVQLTPNVAPPAPVVPAPHNIGGTVIDNSSRLIIPDASGNLNSGDY